ncbi:MAG: OmpA family protein [Bacteroidota bacterium]
MRPILVLPLLFCLTLGLSAQDYVTVEDLDRRSVKRLEAAKSFSRRQEFKPAVAELAAILEKHPNAIDALLLRAQLQYDQEEYALSEQDFEAVLALDAVYNPRAIYQLGLVEFRQEKYAEAVEHYEQFLALAGENDRWRPRVEKYLGQAEVAAELVANPVPFDPISLGPGINTAASESLPSLSANGELLVYTVLKNGQEDFYYSSLQDNGQWATGQPLTGVNTRENEGAQSISADGRTLIFTGCQWPDTYGSCDLYYARQKNGEWGSLRHAAPPLNTRHWDTQPSLSANGDYLYFTSNRPGGFGKGDIWRSKRQEDGSWGEPENLGSTINTDGHEQSPFIHADGQSLYFSSDTHPGMGDLDLFVSRLSPEGEWQQPENLGYPINTSRDEGALIVSLDGETAYFTTAKNTEKGQLLNLDIYQFEMPKTVRPTAATYVEGVVRDAETKQPLSGVEVSIRIDESVGGFARLETQEDGRFLVVLPVGKNYALEANEEGYLFYSDRFELAEAFSRDEPYSLDIELQPVPTKDLAIGEGRTPIVLRNVLFATGSAELLPISEPELNRLVSLLEEFPELRIKINGHTDSIGDDASNLQLSEARAKAVLDYLVQKGIAAERLRSEGFGETRPVADNESEEGRRLNRRTEFEVE